MNRDDPFAEPSDTDKTVININPGGRRPQPMASPSAPPPMRDPVASLSAPATTTDPAQAGTGLNPLNGAAAPLFALVGRIRNRAQHPDADALRENVVREIQAFEARATRAGVPQRTIQIARYALCATIDDVVLNTPWGGRSSWTMRSMVGTFHKETVGGDRFFDLLSRLEKEPATNRELLEFLYVCLSLGFEGRLRIEDRGHEKLLTIREGLSRLIRAHRGPAEADLSIHWKGVELPHKPLSAWLPMWAIMGVTIGILGLSWFLLSWLLASDTERLQGQIAALRAETVPTLERPAPPPVKPPPPPPLPDKEPQIERLQKFLEPEVTEGLVAVLEDANTITVRIAGGGMFPSASDSLKPEYYKAIDRIAEALNGETGPVIIAGHSDADRIRTARFPSNQVLSLKRAEAVMARMAEIVKDPSRMTAEGRADKEPLVPNTTRENKALNRRIEVILLKSD